MSELIKSVEEMIEEEPQTADRGSLYDQLAFADIIDPILKPFLEGKIIADMGTKKLSLHKYIALNRSWIFAKVCQERKCSKWLGIYYMYYKILPPPCKQCWKVVFAPQTLAELLHVQRLQEEQALPAKCGTEARDYTSGLGGYRAFWYCPYTEGLVGGREHFKLVKTGLAGIFGDKEIARRIELGQLYLKRGCTELERDYGPSDSWDAIDHSAKFDILETVWEDPAEMTEEWKPLKYTNIKRWIEFALAYGDKTALNFVRGQHLGVSCVKYHSSKHNPDQFNNDLIDSKIESIED